MNDLPRQKLRELIATYGRSLCDDPRRCEGLLRDVCGAHKREIHVLVSALKERVANDLQGTHSGAPRVVVMARLTKRLQDDLGLTADAASWAVESWALALGVISGVPPKPPAEHKPAKRKTIKEKPEPIRKDKPLTEGLRPKANDQPPGIASRPTPSGAQMVDLSVDNRHARPSSPSPGPTANSFFPLIGKIIIDLVRSLCCWWLGAMLVSFFTYGIGQSILGEDKATALTKWMIEASLVVVVIANIINIATILKKRDST